VKRFRQAANNPESVRGLRSQEVRDQISISTSRRDLWEDSRHMKTETLSLKIILAFFGLTIAGSNTQALIPPPDGGYPGGNTAEGQAALLNLTTGGFNTAVGFLSLRSDITGSFNTAIGAGALLAETGNENTATGAGALLNDQNSVQNTANGAFALFSNTNNNANTATGYQALFQNNGGSNTANGWTALHDNTTGSSNTAIGERALPNNTTGSNNTALGSVAGNNVTTANNVICIGAGVFGTNVSNSCFIGQIFGATSASGMPVLINSDNKLGTTTSSKRFKEEIKPMNETSEALFSLKPVTFHYKKEIDPAGTSQLGLVAEDVEKVNPDLVVRDQEGKPYSVRYDQVNAMLLNEFLKEHVTVRQLKKEIAALTATVKEQAAQVQSMNARLEPNTRPAQLVSNDR
jgi:trimeric autotransporter adhesin